MRRPILAALIAVVLAAALSHNSGGKAKASVRSQGARMKNSWWSKRSSILPTDPTSEDYVGNPEEVPLNSELNPRSHVDIERLATTSMDEGDFPLAALEVFAPCFPSSASYPAQPPLSCYIALRKALHSLSRKTRHHMIKAEGY